MLGAEAGGWLDTGQYLAGQLPPARCLRVLMWRWTMDAQGTMRLMFDTMDAYDRADFDRLAEIYAEDAQWRNADPNGPHCGNRDDIFAMFRQRRNAGIRIMFDELRSTP